MLCTGCSDFLQIFRVGIAFLLLLRNGDGNIAAVFHHVAQGFETRLQPSNANSRRTHVYASAGLAQVKRNADNTNFLGADAGEGCCGWSHEFVKPQSSQRTQSQEIHLRFCARRSSTSKHEN